MRLLSNLLLISSAPLMMCVVSELKDYNSIKQAAAQCCYPGVALLDQPSQSVHCESQGIASPLTCHKNLTYLTSNEFSKHSDSEKTYLKVSGRIFREPFYCVGYVKQAGTPGTTNRTNNVAAVCWAEGEESPPSSLSIFLNIFVITNFISAVLLGCTACIYGLLAATQDTHGICSFHFALCLGLVHVILMYHLSSMSRLSLNFCLTNMYLDIYIIMSAFIWSSISSYNTWFHVRNRYIIDESKLLRNYRYIGYGVPALMVVINNLSAHAARLYTEFSLELDCKEHQGSVLFICFVLPIAAALLANCFFFFDTQRRLNAGIALEMRCERSWLHTIKYKLILNGKLFFCTGLPWTLLCVINFVWDLSKVLTYMLYLIILIISSEGIAIFLILVMFRKRVLKSIAQNCLTNYVFFPPHWKTMKDSETAEDDGAEEDLQEENEATLP